MGDEYEGLPETKMLLEEGRRIVGCSGTDDGDGTDDNVELEGGSGSGEQSENEVSLPVVVVDVEGEKGGDKLRLEGFKEVEEYLRVLEKVHTRSEAEG